MNIRLEVGLKISILLVLLSCGKEYKFNNPVDPECKDPDNETTCPAKSATTAASGSTDNTSGSGPGSPTGSETPTPTTAGAATVAGTVYNFTNSFAVTPSGCSAVNKVQVFDNGAELMIFVLATCSTRAHVYGYKVSYAGIAISTPTMLTSDCNSGTTGVTDFAADKGPNNYLLAYVCKASSTSFITKVMTVSTGVGAGSSTTYETLTDSYAYRLAWNSASSTFGLVRSQVFQRFSESGIAAGGPVTLATFSTYSQFETIEGQWVIVTNGNNVSSGNQYLTTISSSGTKVCNAVRTGIFGSSGGGYLILSGLQKIVGIWQSNDNFSSQAISPATCKVSGDRIDGVAITNTGTSYDIKGELLLNTAIGAVLFTNGKALIMGTYPRSDTFKIHAENSVAGSSTSMKYAEIKNIQNKLYVAYDKDGSGYVTYSTESVP